MSVTRRRHAVKIETSIPRAPHTPREWFVIDCACGWQSPLCATHERADKLYETHRKRTRPAPKAKAPTPRKRPEA